MSKAFVADSDIPKHLLLMDTYHFEEIVNATFPT